MHGKGGQGRCHGRAIQIQIGGRSSRFVGGRGSLHNPTTCQNYYQTICLPNHRPIYATPGYIHQSHGVGTNRGGGARKEACNGGRVIVRR